MKVYAVKTDTEYCGTDMYDYIVAKNEAEAEYLAHILSVENGMSFYEQCDGDMEEYEDGCTAQVVYVGELPESGELPTECPSAFF